MNRSFADRDDLRWLSRVLWPDGAFVIGPDGAGPEPDGDGVDGDRGVEGDAACEVEGRGEHDGGHTGSRWWASPSVDAPRILIPADLGRSTRVAVARYHDGMGPGLRARSALAEAVVGLGSRAASLVLDRSLVTARPAANPAGIDPLLMGPPQGRGPDRNGGVLQGLAEIVGEPDLRFAISLGGPKSNRKPVVQLIDAGGRCRGWAKVGWNDRTDRLVGNEAGWLARRSIRPVRTPALLHDRTIAGRRVVVTGAAGPSRRPRRAIDRPPPAAVFRSVLAMGSADSTTIDRSAWWRSVEAVLPFADDRERRMIEAAVDDAGDRRFRVGAWHGDLTPWNLMTGRDGVDLIDWEFAADGVPFGFDLCHFHTQVGVEMKGLSADRALDRSARLSPQGFLELEVDLGLRRPLWHLYLVELVRRTLALRADGYPLDDVHFGPAAVRRLERAFDRGGRAPEREGSEAVPISPVGAILGRVASDQLRQPDEPDRSEQSHDPGQPHEPDRPSEQASPESPVALPAGSTR